MNAEAIARALGGRRAGRDWMICCPAHDDSTPSLALRDGDNGRPLVRCHAGCGQEVVIAALRARGLWGRGSAAGSPTGGTQVPAHRSTAQDLADYAFKIWRASQPASGTLVETYLRARGLALPATPSLRFHPRLKHQDGSHWPAMVAGVALGDEMPVAIHRTYLQQDGSSKAPVVPQKMMLGPCRGGAVRLAAPGSILMIGEGVETCLAAMTATSLPAWAGLSTSGLVAIELPEVVEEVVVLADGDAPGAAAARRCAARLTHQRRRVRIAWPPAGQDFNDLLLERTPSIMEVKP